MPVFITLNRLSCVLPDGRTLFSDLNRTFASQHFGLVGTNGVGKSVLGRMMAGLEKPIAGSATATGVIYHTEQEPDSQSFSTVAALAGVDGQLAAIARIANGSLDEGDFTLVADHWDCEAILRTALIDAGLGHVDVHTPTSQLSGGERQRVALLGAFLSGADYLILDEPSNHLDTEQRASLAGRIRAWPGGLLLISHDRQLLELMDEIVELAPDGLHSYGGNYSQYEAQRDAQHQTFSNALRAERAAVKREQRQAALQMARQQKRAAHGTRQAKQANQSSLLLDAQQERSENSMGRLQQQQQAQGAAQQERIATAQAQCTPEIERLLLPPASVVPKGTQVLQLNDLVLPFGTTQPLNHILAGPCRIAIKGKNGSGKSTLLKVIAGRLAPKTGMVCCALQLGWLDQHAGLQFPDRSPLEWLQERNSDMTQTDIRMRLAELGIDSARALQATGMLSSGERLKVALAAEIYASPTPQLLLLDEPDNHLDLASKAGITAHA